jgi:hypothetical protein
LSAPVRKLARKRIPLFVAVGQKMESAE